MAEEEGMGSENINVILRIFKSRNLKMTKCISHPKEAKVKAKMSWPTLENYMTNPWTDVAFFTQSDDCTSLQGFSHETLG